MDTIQENLEATMTWQSINATYLQIWQKELFAILTTYFSIKEEQCIDWYKNVLRRLATVATKGLLLSCLWSLQIFFSVLSLLRDLSSCQQFTDFSSLCDLWGTPDWWRLFSFKKWSSLEVIKKIWWPPVSDEKEAQAWQNSFFSIREGLKKA